MVQPLDLGLIGLRCRDSLEQDFAANAKVYNMRGIEIHG
jgi:hypothetical protein